MTGHGRHRRDSPSPRIRCRVRPRRATGKVRRLMSVEKGRTRPPGRGPASRRASPVARHPRSRVTRISGTWACGAAVAPSRKRLRTARSTAGTARPAAVRPARERGLWRARRAAVRPGHPRGASNVPKVRASSSCAALARRSVADVSAVITFPSRQMWKWRVSTRTPRPVSYGGQNAPASVSVRPPDCRPCAGQASRRSRAVSLSYHFRRTENREHITGVATEFNVEGYRTVLAKAHGEAVISHGGRSPVATASSWPSA